MKNARVQDIIHYTKKCFQLLLGIVFLSIGLAGLVAPVLPGIPLSILGITLLCKASGRFDSWMVRNDLKKFLSVSQMVKMAHGFLGRSGARVGAAQPVKYD